MGCVGSSPGKHVDLSQPATLSQFEIQRVIGEGGYGKVNAVTRVGEEPIKWYAMKVLVKESIVERKRVREVFRERDLLTHLKHERLCNSYFSFQDDKFLYLVMDLALGGDLRYQLNHNAEKRPFDESRTRIYIAQVACALEYIHSKRVIHRDIKPENILMNAEGWIKVTDFGISRDLDSNGECFSGSGTPGYIAPEIYCSNHAHGIASDWFSFGVTTYEFLSRKRPFKAEAIRLCRRNPEKLVLDVPSTVSSAASDFLRRLLDGDSKKRLDHEGIKNHSWFKDFRWDKIIDGTHKVPFIPNTKRMNAEPDADIHQVFMGEEEERLLRNLTPEEQVLFKDYEYDYRFQHRLSAFSTTTPDDQEEDDTQINEVEINKI